MKGRGTLGKALGAFGGNRAGNFAMLTALAAIPVLGAAGLAVDYATMSRVRTELQQALDAAVLAVAQRGDDISETEARTIAASYLDGNLSQAWIDMAVEREGTAVRLTAETRAPLAFGGLFGYDSWPINGISTADMAFASYEVALVLDTTGSMRGGKLQSMKDAVIGLIDDLSTRVDDGERLKFALVPFSSFVNVGPHFGPRYDDEGRRIPGTGADWLDLDGRSPVPQLDLAPGVSRFDLYRHLDQEWKGCVETRMASGGEPHDVEDTPALQNDPASLFVPSFAIDEPDSGWYQNNYLEYPGSPYDRPVDMADEKRGLRLLKYGLVDKAAEFGVEPDGGRGRGRGRQPSSRPNGWTEVDPNYSWAEGPAGSCHTQPIAPLSNDYADLKRKVNAFQANGNTNIMEGVAWGMRALSPHAPFSEGKNLEDEPGLEKVMIVLSDGSNVFGNRGNPYGSSYSSFGFLVDGRLDGIRAGGSRVTTDKMNDKTLAACRNAKDKGYIVYTIRLEEPDVETGQMLRDCATSPGHYFDTPSRGQLDGVFKEIRDGITKLRLSS